MKKHSLKAEKRELVGRKVKKLRAQGWLPATVYGKKVESASLTVKLTDFEKVHREAGETGLVELTVNGRVRPILIHNPQRDPVNGQILHAEFYQVDLKEKVRTNVPLELIGEAPAVTNKVGVLLTLLDEVEAEALPADLPEKITVDVSGLSEVGQEVKVGDLKVPTGVALFTDAGLGVAKVDALVSKEAEAQAAAEAAAAEAAAAQVAPVEAEAAAAEKPAEAPPEEPKEEEPKEEKKEATK